MLLEVLLQTPAAPGIVQRISASPETLHAPHLIDVEIAQVMRRYTRQRTISTQRSADVITDLMDFPLTRYPHQPLLRRIWELRHNLTAYDAAYVALAEALDAPLLTRDRALRSAHTGARIELV